MVGIVTLVFGGILGALFINWLNRPLPELSVSSISFDNTTDKNIEIPAHLLGQTNKRISITSRMSWRDLRDAEIELGDLLIGLRELQAKTEEWAALIKPGSGVLSEQDVTACPFIASQDNFDILLEVVMESKESGPIATSVLEKDSIPYDVGIDQSSSPNFRFLNIKLGLDLDDFDGKSIRAFNNFLYSFRTGNRANLTYYADMVIAKCVEGVNKYNDLSLHLNRFLMESSRVAITMTIYNNGKDPILFHPYFKLDISNQANIDENYLLSTIDWRMDELRPLNTYMEDLTTMMKEEFEASGNRKIRQPHKYRSFFQNGESFPHISVQGGRTVTVVLETSEPLGEKAETIRKMYESEALTCGITGIRTDGDLVESRDFMFSPRINQVVKDALYENSR